MDDGFLAEQLERIRQMSEQMSQARARLPQDSEWGDEPASAEETPEQGPQSVRRSSDATRLHPIRDFRTYETHSYGYDAERTSSTRGRSESSHESRRRRRR
jgi:hypothetical protein